MKPVFIILLVVTSFACTKKANSSAELNGSIKLDGSSTVFPISEAMAEEFGTANRSVRVTVGISGTGGGFKKFARNEIDISNASRPMKEIEIQQAKQNNIKYFEIPIAHDGLSIVVNKKNSFANELTLNQLKLIWSKNSKVRTWKDLNPAWPNKTIKLYGPGPDSGTFDYFKEAVLGDDNVRPDYVATEDDNVVVKGVSGDEFAIGYFGFAYYIENQEHLKAVAIAKTDKAPMLVPTEKNILNGSYALSRPVYIYVNHKSAQKKEVNEFIKFYIKNAPKLVPQTGYVPLPQESYDEIMKKFMSWSEKTELTMN